MTGLVVCENDVQHIVQQISNNNIDLTAGDYFNYLQIGFALAEEYAEGGRDFFHAVASVNHKYNSKQCDHQYNNCLKADGHGVTIATFFYLAKEAGLSIRTEKSKLITQIAALRKKNDGSARGVIDLLEEIHDIPKEESEELVTKVFASNDVVSGLSVFEQLEVFLSTEFNFKRNEVTRKIYEGTNEVDTIFMNGIYGNAKKIVNDSVKFDDINRLIYSPNSENFNPLKDFFENRKGIKPEGLIKQLCDTIDTYTGIEGQNPFPDYKYVFVTKWLVGIVASIYGKHSPLLLVLLGGQNTGKTEWFRRLLPKELKEYYAESKLDSGKDDEILMTQKILIMDDELGGKSKRDAKKLKELVSKSYFTLREPYGKSNVDLRRLAVLCGTSNEEDVLNDVTGNRRVIPIKVEGVKFELYNSIDKVQLFMEVFHLFQSGYNWNLTKEEIKILNENTTENVQVNQEQESINSFLRKPTSEKDEISRMSATEIMMYINRLSGANAYRFSNKIGQELKRLGFEQVKTNKSRKYLVVKLTTEEIERRQKVDRKLPF